MALLWICWDAVLWVYPGQYLSVPLMSLSDTYTVNRPNDSIWIKLLGKSETPDTYTTFLSELYAVYFVMIVVVANLGIETYSGYAALVGGWGNEILLEKPPKPLILGPIFKAIGKFNAVYHLVSFTHLRDSGIMRPGLLRLAHLGVPTANDSR
jgi:hypothetical protein